MNPNHKHYPQDIKHNQGRVVEPSKYYSGLSLALKTSYGEVILTADSYDVLEYQASLLMPNEFEIDEGELQHTAIFSVNRVSE